MILSKRSVRRVALAVLVSFAALAIMGCTQYYKVTDTSTNKEYLTHKITKIRGGATLGGIGAARPAEIGAATEYVLKKAPCRVLLTAPPEAP